MGNAGRPADTMVRVGSQVDVRAGQDEETWTIVPVRDADPMAKLISESSPLGVALLGRHPGETVAVRGPEHYRVTIVDIR